MTKDEFREKMQEIASHDDCESRHQEADDLLCKVLRELGYSEGAEIFEKMNKWYS